MSGKRYCLAPLLCEVKRLRQYTNDSVCFQLNTIIGKHSESGGICAEATFLIGNSYQIQDKWGLALGQYKKVIQEYPITLRGIDIPIYIAQYYKAKYQPDKMMAAYQEANGALLITIQSAGQRTLSSLQ